MTKTPRIALSIWVLLGVWSCEHPSQREPASLLRRGLSGDLSSLDPAAAADTFSIQVLQDLYLFGRISGIGSGVDNVDTEFGALFFAALFHIVIEGDTDRLRNDGECLLFSGSVSAGQAYNPRTGASASTVQGSNAYGSYGASTVSKNGNTAYAQHQTTSQGTTGQVQTSKGGSAYGASGKYGNSAAVGQTASGNKYATANGNVYSNTGSGWSGNSNNTQKSSYSGQSASNYSNSAQKSSASSYSNSAQKSSASGWGQQEKSGGSSAFGGSSGGGWGSRSESARGSASMGGGGGWGGGGGSRGGGRR